MIITFSKKEKDFIKQVANLRTIVNEGKNDIKAYQGVTKYMTKEDLNLVSVLTEAGVVKSLGYDLTETPLEVWPSFYLPTHKGLYDGADINHNGRSLEIRRVNKRENPLAIRTKDVQHGAIVVKTFVPHTQIIEDGKVVGMKDVKPLVEVLGWIDAVEAYPVLDFAFWAKKYNTEDKAAYNLNPIEDLIPQEALA